MSESIFFEKPSLKSDSILSNTGKVLIGATGGAALGLSILCFPFVTPAFRRICLPYVPATDTQLRNVLQILKGRSGTLLDVGSGDGRIVIASAKCGFKADGVELNPWLVQYSRITAMLHNVSNKTSFYQKDLWKFDLNKYDNIVVFGVEEMMAELETKIKNEAKPGAAVVACRFPLATLKPEQAIGEGIDTVWIYKP